MNTERLDYSEPNSFMKNEHPRGGWRKWTRRAALVGVVSVAAACALTAGARPGDVGGKKDLKVYQGNAYVGALIEAPLALDPNDPAYQQKLLAAVTQVYQDILASDPPARMAGLAEEIAAQRPDIAALEELYTVEMAPDVDLAPGEFSVLYDYLQLLTDALAAKGAHYKVAVVSTEADVAMPMVVSLDPFALAWGRIIDHEAILVREDLPPGYLMTSNPQTGRFTSYPKIPVGKQTLDLYHGWCSVDVFTRGERFRVICAHPQDESLPDVEKAELAELLTQVANVNMPVMIIADLNTDPFGRNGTDSYPLIAGAGFKDTWAVLNPTDLQGGLTWGHDAALADPATQKNFEYRIDYVLYRGGQFTPTALEIMDPRINSTAPPLWPSDHAAIAATFSLGSQKALKNTFEPARQ